MQAQLDAHLGRALQRDSGLSHADYAVLVNLSEAPEERMRIFELGSVLQWEKSRLSHHLSRMERRGMVQRAGCDTDRRGAFVALTSAGRAAIEQAAPRHVADVRSVFVDVLSPEELDVIAEIGEKVLSHLRDGGAACGDD